MRFALLGVLAVLGVSLAIPSAANAQQIETVARFEVPIEAQRSINGMTTLVSWDFGIKFELFGATAYGLVGKDIFGHRIVAEATAAGTPIGVYTSLAQRELPIAVRRSLFAMNLQFTPTEEPVAAGLNDREVLFYLVRGTTADNCEVNYFFLPDGRYIQQPSVPVPATPAPQSWSQTDASASAGPWGT